MPVTLEPPAGLRQTVGDLLGVPNDGVERWMHDGHFRTRSPFESPDEAVVRDDVLARLMANLPTSREVHSRVLVEVCDAPATVIDFDLVVGVADIAVHLSDRRLVILGRVDLAVHIIRGGDRCGDLWDRLRITRRMAVPLVWVIDPDLKTVAVHRPGHKPVVHNEDADLDGADVLPGFRVPVAKVFAR